MLASVLLLLTLAGGVAPGVVADQDADLTPPRVLENLRARTYSGKPVDLLVSDAPLPVVFARLGEATGSHFDVDPGLRDRVTYRIRQTPWDEILAMVISDNDLNIDSSADGRGFKVYRGSKTVLVFTDPARLGIVLFLYRHLVAIAVGSVLLTAGVVMYLWRRSHRRAADPAARKPLLSPQAADETRRRLLHLLEVDKAYLSDGLSLRDVAAELAVTPHQLSWLVNDVLGQSFSSLVNWYRIEEAKRRLAGSATDAPNMLQIGLDAGFGTKAAFNRAFKKHTGMTPSEYWRTQAN